jgi:hypothetical protein
VSYTSLTCPLLSCFPLPLHIAAFVATPSCPHSSSGLSPYGSTGWTYRRLEDPQRRPAAMPLTCALFPLLYLKMSDPPLRHLFRRVFFTTTTARPTTPPTSYCKTARPLFASKTADSCSFFPRDRTRSSICVGPTERIWPRPPMLRGRRSRGSKVGWQCELENDLPVRLFLSFSFFLQLVPLRSTHQLSYSLTSLSCPSTIPLDVTLRLRQPLPFLLLVSKLMSPVAGIATADTSVVFTAVLSPVRRRLPPSVSTVRKNMRTS